MKKIPVFETKRLILRNFNKNDVLIVKDLIADEEIGKMALSIPYPHKKSMIKNWIRTHHHDYRHDLNIQLAICFKETKEVMGAIGLMYNKEHDQAELGYWMGKNYWKRGYCTEAVMKMLEYGFNDKGLDQVYAFCYEYNHGSRKVLEKVGMCEKHGMDDHIKSKKQDDLICYGISSQDFNDHHILKKQ